MLKVELYDGLPEPQTGIMRKPEVDKYLNLNNTYEAARILSVRKIKRHMVQLDREREAVLEQAYQEGFAAFSDAAQKFQAASTKAAEEVERLTHACLSKVLINCDASVLVDSILGPTLSRTANTGTFTMEVPAARAEEFHKALENYFERSNHTVDVQVEPSPSASDDECVIYTQTGILDFNFSTIADRLLYTVSNNFSPETEYDKG